MHQAVNNKGQEKTLKKEKTIYECYEYILKNPVTTETKVTQHTEEFKNR